MNAEIATRALRVGNVELQVADLRPEQLQAALVAARERASRYLGHVSSDELFTRLDRIVRSWLAPDSEWRRAAEQWLPAITGYSSEMVSHGLPTHFEPLRAPAIENLVREELGSVELGRGPRLLAHVLSGNIPGLAAAPVLLSLATRSAVLVKSAAGDPLFPALLAQSIAALDPELGECVIALHWQGGESSLESMVFESADVVTASGSDAAIAAIAPKVRGRFVGHGHRISFAAIAREKLADERDLREAADRLAYDVTLWDQQGCLSPQLCYLATDDLAAVEHFAQLLADALTRWAERLPPRQLSFDERSAIARFRQQAEWTAVSVRMSSESTTWSISVERDGDFLPSCLNRCLRLKVIDDLSRLAEILSPHRRHLEACGLAAAPERTARLREMLFATGVHHVCAIGEMQRPTLAWKPGGRPRLAEWISDLRFEI